MKYTVIGWRMFFISAIDTLQARRVDRGYKADLDLKLQISNSQLVGIMLCSLLWSGQCDLEWELSSWFVCRLDYLKKFRLIFVIFSGGKSWSRDSLGDM